MTGHVTAEPLLLVLIIFAWTPPHFWALALVRQGFAVKVLEQAPQLGEIGAGIQLGPNGPRIQIEVLGAQDEQIYIEFSTERLAGLRLNLNQIVATCRRRTWCVRPARCRASRSACSCACRSSVSRVTG